MLSAFPAPVLAVTADAVRDLEGREALSGLWALFSKCKDSLQDGRRLENISWRLWYRDIILANAGSEEGQMDQVLYVETEKSGILVDTPCRPPTPNHPPPDYSFGSQGSLSLVPRSPSSSISHSCSQQHHLKRRPSSIRSRRGSFLAGNTANPVSVGKIICDMLPSSSISSSSGKLSVSSTSSLSSNQQSSNQIPTPPSPALMSTGMRHLSDDPKIEAIEEQHHQSLHAHNSSSISGSGDKSSSNSTLADGACLHDSCSQPCLGSEALLSLPSSPSPMPAAEEVTHSSQSNSVRPTNITLPEVSSGRTSPATNLNSSRTIIGASCLPTPEMEVGEAEANIVSMGAGPSSSRSTVSGSSKDSNEDERLPYTGPPSPSLSDSYAAAHPGEVEAQERGLLPSLTPVPSSQQMNASIPSVTPSQDDTSINIKPTPSPTSNTIPLLSTPTTLISPSASLISQSTVVQPSTPPTSSSSNLSAPPQPPRLVVVNPTPNPTPHPTPPATPLIPGAIGFPHGLVHGTGAGASALLRNQWLLPPGAVAAVERSQRRKSREELSRGEGEFSEAGGSEQRQEQRQEQPQQTDAEQNHADEVDGWYGQERGLSYDNTEAEGGGRVDSREEQQQQRSANQQGELRQLSQQFIAPLGYQRPVNRLSVSSTASSNLSNTTTGSSSTNTTSDTSVEMDLGGDAGSECASDLGSTSVGGTEMPRIPSLSTIDSTSTLTHHHHHPRNRSQAASGSGSASTPPAPIPTSPSTSASAKKKKAKRNSAASITGGVLSLSPSSITQSPKSPRTPKSAGPPPSAYNYTSGDIVVPGNVISATTEEATTTATTTSISTTTTTTTTTVQQKRKSITAGSASGAIVRRASSGAGSNRSRSAGRNSLAGAVGRGKNRSTSREPLSAGLEMTMSEAIQSSGSAALLVQKGLGIAQIAVAPPAPMRKMSGGVVAAKGRAKFVLGGKMTRTKSTGVTGHARRTSGGSGAGLGLAKKQNSAKMRKAEEEDEEEEDDEVDDDEGSGDESDEEDAGQEEVISPVQASSSKMQQQQQQAVLAAQAQAQQIMEEQLKLHKEMESKRAEVKRELEERKHMELLAQEARLVEEERQRVAMQRQQMLQRQEAEAHPSSLAGRRAARFNIGSNSDDGSNAGGKSTGSGSDVSPDRRGEEEREREKRNEEQLRLLQAQQQQFQHAYPSNAGPSHIGQQQLQQPIHQVDHQQLAFEYQQRQLQQQQQQALQLQQQQAAQLQQQQQQQQAQYDAQFIRQLSKPQLAQLQKMQQLHQGANVVGMLSRQASTKQVAPPAALTQNVSKGKERQQEPVAELGRQTSTSSKGKERSRDFVKSVSPKKPGKHARGQALPLDAAELDARVKQSLAEPLLPQGNKKTIVLTSDDSEYSTDEWSSDDNDEEELRREKEQKEKEMEAKRQQQMLMQHAQQLLQQQQTQQQQQQPTRPAFHRNHSSHYPAANNARGKQLTRKQAHMAVAQANTQLLVEQAARELRELQKREEREREQRDLFKKLPSESFQNLAAARTRSVGLLTQLMNPDPTIFPPNHPYRRGHSSGEIRHPPGIAPLKPMTKVEERPAQQQPPVKPEDPVEAPVPPRAPVASDLPPPNVAPQGKAKAPAAQVVRTNFSPPPRTASMSKSPVAQPVSSFFHQAGSFARKAGALVGMAPLVGTGSSSGYRPKGRPQDQELESDTDGEEDQANTTQLSKSVAQEKLMALVRRGQPAAAVTAGPVGTPATTKGAPALPLPEGDSPPPWARATQPGHGRSQSQGQASTSRVLPNYTPAPIPVGHPYNLPPAAPPSTPTTTRRAFVRHELSESLRANIIWERQVSRGPDPAILRRTASNGRRLVPSPTVPNMVKLHAKGTVNPADLPVVPNDDREQEARKQRALKVTATLAADDYHISGW